MQYDTFDKRETLEAIMKIEKELELHRLGFIKVVEILEKIVVRLDDIYEAM